MKMIEKNNAAKDRSTMLSPGGGLVFKYSVKEKLLLAQFTEQ